MFGPKKEEATGDITFIMANFIIYTLSIFVTAVYYYYYYYYYYR
jgi:hypothetical protein